MYLSFSQVILTPTDWPFVVGCAVWGKRANNSVSVGDYSSASPSYALMCHKLQ